MTNNLVCFVPYNMSFVTEEVFDFRPKLVIKCDILSLTKWDDTKAETHLAEHYDVKTTAVGITYAKTSIVVPDGAANCTAAACRHAVK